MIQKFVDAFLKAEDSIKEKLRSSFPGSYEELVMRLVETLHDDKDYDTPDPKRITVIDHGKYQGTLLFVVGAFGYQPSTYWSIFVSYGSCSGCDTFQAIQDDFDCSEGYTDRKITDTQVNDLWSMMLHMVQSMKVIGEQA